MANKVKRVWIECRKCNNKWFPNSNKWRDKTIDKPKKIQCPKCMTVNIIPVPVVEQILELQTVLREIVNWGEGEV